MVNKTRKSARRRFDANKTEAVAVVLLLGALAVLAVANSGASYSTTDYGSMESMMSGSPNQNLIAQCNQMMAGFGLSQSAIAEMDQMMASGNAGSMMQMMSSWHIP